MEFERSTDAEAEASPSKLMRRFVECVDEGDVRRELAEDCILNIFARCVKGVAAVTGYMRTQITGRYKHLEFKNANVCDTTLQMTLSNRYGRSFEVLRRRLNAKRSPGVVPERNLRAESDDDADAGNVTNPKQLATPTKPASSTTKASMQYIESIGVLEAAQQEDSDDGGMSIESPCKIKLTLGYRSTTSDICLIIYEKLPTTNRARPQTGRCLPGRHVHTDDEEGEEPAAPRSVRRALFASDADCEATEESAKSIGSIGSALQSDADNSPNYKSVLTPRKRQHKKDPFKNLKRSMRF
ncbi:hypothetical protein ACLKA6_005795 [Drosophila palustris]